jgi:arsenite/tail-anchored protein-transporting ATPase
VLGAHPTPERPLSLSEPLDRRVVFVAGKGGVGRTTVAAALALAHGAAGRRTLLAEFEEPTRQTHSPLAQRFGRTVLPDAPETVAPGVEAVLLQSRVGTEQFLGSVLRVDALARLALRTPALLRLLQAAPSFHELGLFYHLLDSVRATVGQAMPRWERIVVDMPATGHALALTQLPELFLEVVHRGPIAEAMRQGQAVFYDPDQTAALVVTLPEPLPVSEALELLEGLRQTRIPVGALLANRLPADPFQPGEREALEALLDARPEGRALQGCAELDRMDRCAAAMGRLRREARVPLRVIADHVAPAHLGARAADRWVLDHVVADLRRAT